MITISLTTYPSHNPKLLPNELTFDTGYSKANYDVLFGLAQAHELKDDYHNNFQGYFILYDKLSIKNCHIRNDMPELGYSPYNFTLLIQSLGIHKRDLAAMIGCSFSKIIGGSSPRYNNTFIPLVGNQWIELLEYYRFCVAASDEVYGLNHDLDALFYLKSDKALPLNIPEF